MTRKEAKASLFMNVSSAPSSDSIPSGAASSGILHIPARLHRIQEIRHQEEISLRSLRCRTGESVYDLRREERQAADLMLSRLNWWKRLLDVPIADLLTEPEAGFSPLVRKRVQLLRIMKTVASIHREASSESLSQLAQALEQQLLEIVPEMRGALPWPTLQQRRTLDELGRAAERIMFLDELLGSFTMADRSPRS